jgi:UDP-N-acetylmuramoyl-L-alanyl-D-glutamate--2,6-diaminopimelate ligase
MNLNELTSVFEVKKTYNYKDIKISDVEYFSKEVKKGALFFCIKAPNYKENNFKGADGHMFIEESLKNGAAAFVVTTEYDNNREVSPDYKKSFDLLNKKGIPVIVVESTLKAVSKAAAHFYDHPSQKLSVVGVTGTNGKTTVTYLLEHVLNESGYITGVVGTVSYRYAGKEIKNIEYTTPKSLYLQRIMDTMLHNRVTHFFMEVSSHSIDFDRVNDIDFNIAIFNNLTRDHIDFHQTMENYFDAKKKLFTKLLPASSKHFKYAIINNDCEYGKRLANETRGFVMCGINTLTFSFDNDRSDLQVIKSEMSEHGTKFTARIFDEEHEFQIPLVGKHNVYNAIAVILTCHAAYGIKISDLQTIMKTLPHAPGRLEKIGKHNVFVDYAHTDDALKNAITSLRGVFPDKKIITIFGCGGNRDSGKRPRMGKVVSDLSDLAVVTSDNPRFECPNAIIKDIVAGIEKKNFVTIPDRTEAIKKIISEMNPKKDVILIAGKGHEDYQEINGVKHPFSDAKVATQILKGGKK